MRGYTAFLKKEFMESVRSYKIFIFPAVFLILGMMNPLTAKLTPMLMESLTISGIKVEISDPTALDSWIQFYKNVPQMGLAVVIIIFSGVMSHEYSKGTLTIMLTRGLSRPAVILSKFTWAAVLWTISYVLCVLISWVYTAYFWTGAGLDNIALSAFLLWLFGMFIISLIILGGALFSSTYGNLLFTAGIIVVQLLINIIPETYKYMPIALASKNLDLIKSDIYIFDMTPALAITCFLTVGFTALAIFMFDRKRI